MVTQVHPYALYTKYFIFRAVFILWGALFFSMIWAQAPKQLAKVKLKNGNTSEGEIIEEVPADHIKLKLHDNETKIIPYVEVERVTRFQQVGHRWGFTTRRGKITKRRGYVGFFEGHFQTGLTYFSKIQNLKNNQVVFKGKDVKKNGEKVVSIMTIHGYQFNPHFILGGGFGFEFHADALKYDHHMLGFPVFGFARTPLLNRWVSPFFDFKLGYIYRIVNNNKYNFPQYFYFFDYKRLNFHGLISGISFGIQVQTSARESLYATFGPQAFYSRYRKEEMYYQEFIAWEKELLNINLNFSLGIRF